jgi:hypothetical protein
MRGNIAGFLTLVLGSALTEAATYGKLHTYDIDTASRSIHQYVFNADVARLILERRMRPSQSSPLGTVDENTIELIEDLGGHQTYLFGDEEDHQSRQRLLVICESGNISEGTLIAPKELLEAKREKGTKNVANQGNSISFPLMSSDLIKDDFIYNLLDQSANSIVDSRACSTGSTNLRVNKVYFLAIVHFLFINISIELI